MFKEHIKDTNLKDNYLKRFVTTMATDHFCLIWNNFQNSILSALGNLQTCQDLVDVTLMCEGHNVKAHKVILSACSPYFRNLFKV